MDVIVEVVCAKVSEIAGLIKIILNAVMIIVRGLKIANE